MVIDEITNLVESMPGRVKRSGVDYEIEDMLRDLRDRGYQIQERALRRVLIGLGLRKSPSGYYSKPDLAIVVCWQESRDRYHSYEQFMTCIGRSLYDRACLMFGNQ